MRRFGPEIFRKRLLIEGYFARQELHAETIRDYFVTITGRLGLRTYARPGRAAPRASAAVSRPPAVPPDADRHSAT